MNKYREIKTKPNYFYRAQKIANQLPAWTTARKDKHSNYQSIVSDLIEPLENLIYESKLVNSKLLAQEYDTGDNLELYKFAASGLNVIERERTAVYQDPIQVVSDDSITGETEVLVKCPHSDFLRLNDRQPLAVKSLTDKVSPLTIIETISPGKYLLSVRENCYINVSIFPKDGSEISISDFFVKLRNLERNEDYRKAYIFGTMSLLTYENKTEIQKISVLPDYHHSFRDPVIPGFYYLVIDEFLPEDISLFDVSISFNFAYQNSKRCFYNAPYYTQDFSYNSYWEIEDDNLCLYSKNYTGEKEKQKLENYVLLDLPSDVGDVGTITPQAWVKKEMVLYTIPYENPDKLYLYDLFLEGNAYLYEDNYGDYIKLEIDAIDYKPGDEITIETRTGDTYSPQIIREVRLKIENNQITDLVDIDEENEEIIGALPNSFYYIDRDGNVVNEDAAWRKIDDQQIRWNLKLDYLGSYKVTCEGFLDSKTGQGYGSAVGLTSKMFVVGYKDPFKVIDLGGDYSKWRLGINTNQEIELIDPATGNRKVISFYKDGYYFDNLNGTVWTSTPFESLTVGY